MNPQFIRLAITLDNGMLDIRSFVTVGRGPVVPSGGLWLSEQRGLWTREATPENIQAEVDRSHPGVSLSGLPLPRAVSWRVIPESDVPTDRDYRDACEDTGTVIQHNLPKARELCRQLLRHERATRFVELDAQWMRATGQGDKAEQGLIEATRQQWRDIPADPRIDIAQSVEALKQIRVG